MNVLQGLFVSLPFYPEAEPCSSPPSRSVAESEISESSTCTLCINEKTVRQGTPVFGSSKSECGLKFCMWLVPFSVWAELVRSSNTHLGHQHLNIRISLISLLNKNILSGKKKSAIRESHLFIKSCRNGLW